MKKAEKNLKNEPTGPRSTGYRPVWNVDRERTGPVASTGSIYAAIITSHLMHEMSRSTLHLVNIWILYDSFVRIVVLLIRYLKNTKKWVFLT
jgi:hypothetical protein